MAKATATDPKNDTTEAPEPKTTVTAKLRALDHRGNTVSTRWGSVTFDKDGLAELEVPEEELPMLRAMQPYSWLAEDHTSYQAELEEAKKPKAKPELKPEGKKGDSKLDGKKDEPDKTDKKFDDTDGGDKTGSKK